MAVSLTQRNVGRLLVGRKVVAAGIETFDSGRGYKSHSIHWLKLDNGATVSFSVEETEGDYAVRAAYRKARS